MSMIEIVSVHKQFGTHEVLRGVNLAVERGESMTVIGGSGSGKSVLIKHIIGLLFPDRGQVIVDGQILNKLDAIRLINTDFSGSGERGRSRVIRVRYEPKEILSRIGN